jgi:type VI secretion system secreted protein VgrG
MSASGAGIARNGAKTITAGKGDKVPLLTVHGLPADLGKPEIIGMTGEEELSRPYVVRIEVQFPSLTPEAVITRLLGQALAVELATDPSAGGTRFIHGEVCAITRDRLPGSPVPDVLGLVLRPRLFRLGLSSEFRLFTNMTVRAMVDQILRDNGIPAAEWRLAPGVPMEPRPVTIQPQMTHLDFVTALLEEHGLTYFFEHTVAGHTFVITDHPAGFTPLSGTVPVRAPQHGSGGDAAGPSVFAIRQVWELPPAGTEVRGRTVEKPNEDLVAPTPGRCRVAGGVMRESGCEVSSRDAAKVRAEVLMRGMDAAACRVTGSGTMAAFAPGQLVTLDDSPAPRRYLITSVRHDAQMWGSVRYSNQFDAHPAEVRYAPPMAARPRIPGPVSAVVSTRGGLGGRVKVKFDFDRSGTESGWLEVDHPAGVFFNPQVGQRVRVLFVAGDPDRPVVGHWHDTDESLPLSPKERPDRGGVYSPLHAVWYDDGEIKRMTTAVAGDQEELILGDATRVVTGPAVERYGKDYGLRATGEVVISAGKKLIFKVGGNFIVIDSSGITINGKKLRLNPPGAADPGNGPKPKRTPKNERKPSKKK